MSVTMFNDWSASLTALAAAILWQSTLLAGLVAGICWVLRRGSPGLRYWCWQIVALKLLLMPWWIVALPLPDFLSADAADVAPPPTQTIEHRQGTRGAALNRMIAPPAGEAELASSDSPAEVTVLGQLTWRSWLVLAWLGGIAWQLGCLLVQHRRLRRILRHATVATEPRMLALLEEAAAQLGLSRRPALVLLEGVSAPFVVGLWRPVLVLPRGLLAEIDPDQWRAVLLHELAHLQRRDLWWGWLPALARLVYFFHPVAHGVCFRIRLERELACDQLAMTLSGRSAADYAEILVQVVRHASMPSALTMSALEGLSTFWKRRLTMLLSTSRSSPQLSRRACLTIMAAALMACLLPTLQHIPAQAPSSQAEPAAKAQGRIYVSATIRYKPEGEDEEKKHAMILAIDPATGRWQKITDQGYDGRVSPDGQTFVFSRHGDGIWNCDTGGSNNPGKISDKSGRPIWSPDGKYLVATRQELIEKDTDEKPRKTPAWKDETWRLDADGRNPVKLSIPETDSVEDWSPDGQWFVTCSDRHAPFGSGYQLYLMKTDGGQQRRLTQGGLNVFARFSPDGKKILYLRQTAKAGNSIWTMDLDGKNARELVKEVDLASPDGAYWSPDGKQIAVILFNWERGEDGKRVIRNPENANFRIEIMDADGTNRRPLQLQGATFVFIGSLGDWR
jgi:beta-lactamase regulating signal transducer with metallopeptidase domain